MSCTAEEIAEKRRIALERLKKHKQVASSTLPTPVSSSTSLSTFNNTKSIATNSKAFYGSSPLTKAPNKPTYNAAKLPQPNPYQNARISSQPYNTHNQQQRQTKPNALAPVFTKQITCVCSMINDHRFIVTPSGYHAKLIDVFKTIPSREYSKKLPFLHGHCPFHTQPILISDPNTKIWSFNMSDYSLVHERVALLNPDVVIGALPKFVIKLLSEPAKPFNFTCISSLEPTVGEALMNFQKEGVCFGIEKKGRCMIADEMGLGKTYQAIALADFYKEDWPLLVVTTAGTRYITSGVSGKYDFISSTNS